MQPAAHKMKMCLRNFLSMLDGSTQLSRNLPTIAATDDMSRGELAFDEPAHPAIQVAPTIQDLILTASL
ncbi:hypothetical protein X759_12355 [Mesorhizobium sp. LSHC420B00]|nr:hypothetical protein X759_12355 [Mesorhizobium sp. LSHC420B00]